MRWMIIIRATRFLPPSYLICFLNYSACALGNIMETLHFLLRNVALFCFKIIKIIQCFLSITEDYLCFALDLALQTLKC